MTKFIISHTPVVSILHDCCFSSWTSTMIILTLLFVFTSDLLCFTVAHSVTNPQMIPKYWYWHHWSLSASITSNSEALFCFRSPGHSFHPPHSSLHFQISTLLLLTLCSSIKFKVSLFALYPSYHSAVPGWSIYGNHLEQSKSHNNLSINFAPSLQQSTEGLYLWIIFISWVFVVFFFLESIALR